MREEVSGRTLDNFCQATTATTAATATTLNSCKNSNNSQQLQQQQLSSSSKYCRLSSRDKSTCSHLATATFATIALVAIWLNRQQ